MKKATISFIIICSGLFFSSPVYAEDEDIFADYTKDMRKNAKSNATNVYNAYGDNMANMIESGYRDGVVVKGEGSYAGGKVKADGVGNVFVDKHANVGPVINKSKIQNSTVIFKNNSKKNNW